MSNKVEIRKYGSVWYIVWRALARAYPRASFESARFMVRRQWEPYKYVPLRDVCPHRRTYSSYVAGEGGVIGQSGTRRCVVCHAVLVPRRQG